MIEEEDDIIIKSSGVDAGQSDEESEESSVDSGGKVVERVMKMDMKVKKMKAMSEYIPGSH